MLVHITVERLTRRESIILKYIYTTPLYSKMNITLCFIDLQRNGSLVTRPDASALTQTAPQSKKWEFALNHRGLSRIRVIVLNVDAFTSYHLYSLLELYPLLEGCMSCMTSPIRDWYIIK